MLIFYSFFNVCALGLPLPTPHCGEEKWILGSQVPSNDLCRSTRGGPVGDTILPKPHTVFKLWGLPAATSSGGSLEILETGSALASIPRLPSPFRGRRCGPQPCPP